MKESGLRAPSAFRARYRQRGYIMIATALSLIFLLGVVGLSVDIGRMYITKNELQPYTASATVAAAIHLDGSSAGITRALAAHGSDKGKWRIGTTTSDSVTTSFATSSGGTYTTAPPDPPTGYTYARVVAVVNLPMYL